MRQNLYTRIDAGSKYNIICNDPNQKDHMALFFLFIPCHRLPTTALMQPWFVLLAKLEDVSTFHCGITMCANLDVLAEESLKNHSKTQYAYRQAPRSNEEL